MAQQTEKHEDLLRVAKERFEVVSTAVAEEHEKARKTIKFGYNIEDGQWPSDIRTDREAKKRICLTSNKIRKFIAQESNKERESRPVNRVIPVDDGSDVEMAKIYDDIIRQIMHQSKAHEVYTNAGEQAISGGFGFWRVLSDYVDDGFDQELSIKWIENQFSVYYDPRRRYCFIREALTHEEFKEEYPSATVIDFEGSSVGGKDALWYEKDKVFVVEYFYKKSVMKEIAEVAQILDPETGARGETQVVRLKDGLTEAVLKREGYEVLRTRKVKSHEIRWVKMTGSEVLEERTLPGKHIPVIEVVGDRISLDGKVYKRSLIADGIEPQMAYNFWLTNTTETIAMAPNAPYILTAEQVEGKESQWQNVNVDRPAYLPYNHIGGVNKPSREPPPQVPQGAAFMLNVCDKDIQDTIGMYESSFGQRSNERSGVAIDARANRSDLGTYHFRDNLDRAMNHTARILIELIPVYMDNERVIRIRGVDGPEANVEVDPETGQEIFPEETFVTINEVVLDESGKTMTINDLSVGKYDVRENIRSAATRRQENVKSMIEAMQYAPSVADIIVGELFKQQDFDGAQELAKKIEERIVAVAQGGGGQPPQ